jgi:hypothetical protein
MEAVGRFGWRVRRTFTVCWQLSAFTVSYSGQLFGSCALLATVSRRRQALGHWRQVGFVCVLSPYFQTRCTWLTWVRCCVSVLPALVTKPQLQLLLLR